MTRESQKREYVGDLVKGVERVNVFSFFSCASEREKKLKKKQCELGGSISSSLVA